jgi:hypothetical protein
LGGSKHSPTSDEHNGAPHEKADIPVNPLGRRDGFVDVVNPEKMMVDYSFDHVKDAEPDQEASRQRPVGPPNVYFARALPQNDKTGQHKDVCARMENTVPQRIHFEIVNTVGRVSSARKHVMPLKQLMKNNPVEKTSQAET